MAGLPGGGHELELGAELQILVWDEILGVIYTFPYPKSADCDPWTYFVVRAKR